MSGWRAPRSNEQAPIEKAASRGGRNRTVTPGRRPRNDRNAPPKAALNKDLFNHPERSS